MENNPNKVNHARSARAELDRQSMALANSLATMKGLIDHAHERHEALMLSLEEYAENIELD